MDYWHFESNNWGEEEEEWGGGGHYLSYGPVYGPVENPGIPYQDTLMGRRLAPEMLSMIFLWCLPGLDKQPTQLAELYSSLPDEGSQGYEAAFAAVDRKLFSPMIPLILSSVCRDWRECALGTAGLWSNLVFDGRIVLPTFGYDMAREWMMRSKRHPLTLQWKLGESTEGIEERLEPKYRTGWMFDIVLEEAPRWSHIHITTAYEKALVPLSKHIGPPFESLKSLWLDMEGITTQNLPSINQYIVERAPSLREFRLFLKPSAYHVELSDYTQKCVTHLKLRSSPADTILGFLDGCPSLVCAEFEVEGIEDAHRARPRSEIVVHPRLTSLTVKAASKASDVTYLFDKFTTPNLTKLDLTCPSNLINDRSFQEFLSRSSCKLQSFRLRVKGDVSSDNAAASMVGFLGHPCVSSSLHVLDFWNPATICRFTDELIQFLTVSSSTNILPRLRELYMSGSIDTDDGLSAMADMLESRFRPEVDMDAPDNDGIRALAKAKLALEVDPIRGSHRDGDSKIRDLKRAGFKVEHALEWCSRIWSRSEDD